jgi:hypothetical protein
LLLNGTEEPVMSGILELLLALCFKARTKKPRKKKKKKKKKGIFPSPRFIIGGTDMGNRKLRRPW